MRLSSDARTDVGITRDHNEDTYGLGEGDVVKQSGDLLVVCDGMGGHAAGEVASQLAVAAILEAYYQDTSDDRPTALEHAFVVANNQVYRQGRGSMGTTGVAAALYHDALHVANVGDSRAYLVRENTIRQITRDHSFVGDQVAAGLLTPEQARVSAHRNIITRALGHQPDVTVDLFRWPLQVGDIVLLCSDGLHGLLSDSELLEVVNTQSFESVVDVLVDMANERGGIDNITAVIGKIEALDWDTQPILLEHVLTPASTAASQVTEQITDRIVVTPEPAAPATIPQERRLSLLGGLLATLLLATMLFAILFVYLNPAPVLAPTTAPNTAATTIATTPASIATPTAAAAPTNAP